MKLWGADDIYIGNHSSHCGNGYGILESWYRGYHGTMGPCISVLVLSRDLALVTSGNLLCVFMFSWPHEAGL